MTSGAIEKKICGSANSWKEPITEKIPHSRIAGRSSGSLMWIAVRNALAPSTAAASYSSAGIARSAA